MAKWAKDKKPKEIPAKEVLTENELMVLACMRDCKPVPPSTFSVEKFHKQEYLMKEYDREFDIYYYILTAKGLDILIENKL